MSERWVPHGYQKRAVKHLLAQAAAGLFLDPGLGKTSITLKALAVLLKEGLIERALVVAPLRVAHAVWPAEVAKWKDFAGLRVAVLHGKEKEARLRADADLYVINPEGLNWLLTKVVRQVRYLKPNGEPGYRVDAAAFAALGFGALVVDELSRFKNGTGVAYRLLRDVLPTFRYRWGLTGSPAPNGLLDLHAQLYVLDLGRSLGRWFTKYRSTYFLPIDEGNRWVPRDGAEEEIQGRLRPVCLRMAAADYLDLPPLVETDVEVDLPPRARTVYDELEDLWRAEVGPHLVSVATAAAASTKLRQVASGGLYVDGLAEKLLGLPREWKTVHSAKAEALADLVAELQGQPLLVAYEFRHEVDQLRAVLGDVPHIGGDVNVAAGDRLMAAWNRGELPVLLAHPRSLGHGVNLQGDAAHVAFYSLPWDLELYDQLIRRVLRQGTRATRVLVYRFLARATVDRVVALNLRRKDRTQSSLLAGLREYVRRRS